MLAAFATTLISRENFVTASVTHQVHEDFRIAPASELALTQSAPCFYGFTFLRVINSYVRLEAQMSLPELDIPIQRSSSNSFWSRGCLAARMRFDVRRKPINSAWQPARWQAVVRDLRGRRA